MLCTYDASSPLSEKDSERLTCHKHLNPAVSRLDADRLCSPTTTTTATSTRGSGIANGAFAKGRPVNYLCFTDYLLEIGIT